MSALAPRFGATGDAKVYAGEVLSAELAFTNGSSATVDLTGRQFVLVIWVAKTRAEVVSVTGELRSDSTGNYVYFELSGDATEDIFQSYGSLGLRVALAEVISGGLDYKIEGALRISSSPSGVTPELSQSTAGPPISRFVYDYSSRRTILTGRGGPGLAPWQALGMSLEDYDAEVRAPAIAAAETADGATVAALQSSAKAIAAAATATTNAIAAQSAATAAIAARNLSGEGPPASGLGVDGNTYTDTLNKLLYKKVAGSWGAGSPLKGDPGGNVMSVGAASVLSALSVPAGATMIQTSEAVANSRKGATRFRRVPTMPTHGGRIRSADRFLPDGTVDAANGGWFEIAEDVLDPCMAPFNAAGDDSTNDAAALQQCFAVGAQLRRSVIIRKDHYINPVAATDAVEVPSNSHIIFQGGSVRLGMFGLPLFYNHNGTNIRIENPRLIYDATATSSLPAVNTTFAYTTINLGAYAINPSNMIALILLLGSRGVVITNPTMYAKTMENTKLIPYGVTIGTGSTGLRPIVDVQGDTVFDGTIFGYLAWNVERFTTGDIYSDRWGQLSSSGYSWCPPGHVAYYTPNGYSVSNPSVVEIGNCFDLGTMVSGADAAAGSPSYKFTGRPRSLQVGNLWSQRAAGVLDHDAANYSIGDVFWSPPSGTNAYLSASKALRMGATSLGAMTGRIGRVKFVLPADTQQAGLILLNGQRNMTFDIDVYSPAAQLANLITGALDTCQVNLSLQMPNGTGGETLMSLQGVTTSEDGVILTKNTRIEIVTDNPAWSTLRVVEQNTLGDLIGNTVRLLDQRTGSEQLRGQGGRSGHQIAVATLPCTAGAVTLTATNLIPKGAMLWGLTSLMNPAAGTSGGLTGFKVGSATDDDRFGVRNGIGLNVGTQDADWTSDLVNKQLTALSVIVTAVSGTFDGTGAITLRAVYFIAERNSDLL